MDESGIRSQYVGQNISQLRHSIDSIGRRVDSIGNIYSNDLRTSPYVGVVNYASRFDSTGHQVLEPKYADEDIMRTVASMPAIDIDSVFNSPSAAYAKTYLGQAVADARRTRQEFEYKTLILTEQAKLMRRHDIEMQRKFTLSFAVLVFFFIGAPLGAIIKKGGIGTPLVISVFLFIVYFIFDNMGYKMARDGKLPVWEGMWLSTVVLLPLGIFFTVKAIDDSAVFNIDAYRNFFRRLAGIRSKRSLEMKEIVMNEVDAAHALALLESFMSALAESRTAVERRPTPFRFLPGKAMRRLRAPLNELVDYLSNSTDKYVISHINEYPFEPRYKDLPHLEEVTRQLINIYSPSEQNT